jgi:ribosomal RNA methyltransferase Nop2
MTSAPSGKATYLAAVMRNNSFMFTNDATKKRSKDVIGNVKSPSVKNTIVCNYFALELPRL